MRDAVRRLFSVRPQPRIVQVRVPSIIAGRRGLPVLLSAFAVVAAASTAADDHGLAAGRRRRAGRDDRAAAGRAADVLLPGLAGGRHPAAARRQASRVAPGSTAASPAGRVRRSSRPTASRPGPCRPTSTRPSRPAAASRGRWSRRSAGSSPTTASSPARRCWPTAAPTRRSSASRWTAGRASRRSRTPTTASGTATPTYDRAVGPMQFIPSSWATFGLDGDGDGKADPFDIDDAAASAAKYLCRAGGGDLSNEASQRNAVYSYNRSDHVRGHGHGAGRGVRGRRADRRLAGPERDAAPAAADRGADAPAGLGRRPAGRAGDDHAQHRRPAGTTPTTGAAPGRPRPRSRPTRPIRDPRRSRHPGPTHAAGAPRHRRRRRARRHRQLRAAAPAVAVADLHAGSERQPEPVAGLVRYEHAERDRLGRRHADVRRRERGTRGSARTGTPTPTPTPTLPPCPS